MARMGDLIQMLPLIEALSREGPVTLLCDRAVEDWGRILPGIGEIVPLDTRHWRGACTSESFHLPLALRELMQEPAFAAGNGVRRIYGLNDHPAADALVAGICPENPAIWLNSKLILMRAYLRAIGLRRTWNRVHLSDLWRFLAPNRIPAKTPFELDGTQFAKNPLRLHSATGLRRRIAVVLGSGGKYRRLDPKFYAEYWKYIQEYSDIGLVLIGDERDRRSAEEFLRRISNISERVVNLIGKCNPAELIAVLSEVDLVVGVDTGPLHWAAALGTRVLGFYFAEAGLHDTGPYGHGHLVISGIVVGMLIMALSLLML